MVAKYTVVLATYNEAENLPIVVALLQETFVAMKLDYKVLVVDDNSPDGTGTVFESLKTALNSQPHLESLDIIRRSGKLGLGTAYLEALQHINTEFTIIMDCDLSHHPKYIKSMIKTQSEGGKNYDIVIGSRYVDGGGVVNWPYFRRFVSTCANYYGQTLLRPKAADLTGSFRLYKTAVLKKIGARMISPGFTFQAEAIARASVMGYEIAEVPIIFNDRLYGKSNFNLGEMVQFATNIFKLFYYGLNDPSNE